MSNNTYVPRRVMVVRAHPDDIEFSCAGTIARWVKEGAEVCYVLVTSGDVGINDPKVTRQEAAQMREAEQIAAAAAVGVTNVVFLREPDGMVQATMELRKKIVREIRKFRPDLVMAGDPQMLWTGDDYINHPDHRASALATIDAIFPAAGQPALFQELEQEGLTSHKTYKVYIESWGGDATTFINITDTIDLKINALRAHKSQMKDWDPADEVRKWSAERGKGKEMEYAEGYRVVTFGDAVPEWLKEEKKEEVPAAAKEAPEVAQAAEKSTENSAA